MQERVTEILNQLESIEEELTDIAFQILSDSLQDAENTAALEQAKQLEKTLVKARRSVEKAKQDLQAHFHKE